MYSRRELDDLEYRYYCELKDGTRKVKISDSLFRCPFCYLHRKRDYNFDDLLRHAYNISGSSRTKDGARHLALERYMKKYLRPLERPSSDVSSLPTEVLTGNWKTGSSSSAAGEVNSSVVKSSSPCIAEAEPMSVSGGDDPVPSGEERQMFSPKPSSSLSNQDSTHPSKRACLTAGAKESEKPVQQSGLSHGAPRYPQRRDRLAARNDGLMFVHPWKGILANISRIYNEKTGKFAGESGSKIREEFVSKGFNPHKVEPLWNGRVGFTGFAIVYFGKDWEAYRNATMFEKHFEVNQCGKRDFDAARDRGEELYGWIAKREDYYSRTVVGDHLRKQGDLVTVSGKEAEQQRRAFTLVSNLENTLETKSTNLEEIESKYKETSTELQRSMKEKDEMINAHNEKMSSMQQKARDYLASVKNEHEKAAQHLEAQRKEFEERERYLDKCQSLNKTERRKLQWQKQKNLMATEEQNKADEEMTRLAKQQQVSFIACFYSQHWIRLVRVLSIVFNPTVRNLRRFDLIRVPAVSDRVSPRKVTVILRSNLLIMNYLLGAFKPACNVSITFTDGKNRKQVPIKKDNGQTVMNPLFQSQETIAGKVIIEPYQGKKVEHNGVKVELLGQIEMYFDRGNFYDFTSLVRELDVPGEIYEKKAYPFEFSTVEMPHETYNGVNVRLRYVLKVTVTRGYGGSIVEYQDFVVRNYSPLPPINNSIKMEVGIEDCLHIEFEYNKSKYHLKDVILGKIYFLLVRIKIKNMDLEIRRRESTGAGANTHVETETLAKFELMDGAPVRGESIPVRLFLTPYDLTPTLTNINNKFSVKYYLNLVLVDEEDRRYFKQQEITLYRLKEETS